MDTVLICPFFYIQECQWRGVVTEMTKHFIRAHRTAYKPHPLTVEIDGDNIHQFVTVAFNTIFFVQIKVNLSVNIECAVKCLHVNNKDEFHFYTYHIHTEHENLTFINLLGEMQGFCYPDQMQCFDFGLQSIPTQHTEKTVKCRIKICKKCDTEAMEVATKYNVRLVPSCLNLKQEFEQEGGGTGFTMKLKQCDSTFLEELECPVCSNYMTALIFNCTTGHSICQDCSAKLLVCPICSSEMTDTRSYSLENLISRLRYPCKYLRSGCPQILDCQSGPQHYEECLYKTIRCPFKFCERSITRLALSNHCEREHEPLLFKEDQALRKVLTTPSVSYNFTIFENEVFQLRFKCQGETNSVKFDCIHANETDIRKMYAFEVQFVSETDANQRLVVSNNCKKNFRNFEDDTVVIPLPLLKPFISIEPEPTLNFKCLIKKI